MEAMMNPLSNQQQLVNEKYKYDINTKISKKISFKAFDFHYQNNGQEKPKILYISTDEKLW